MVREDFKKEDEEILKKKTPKWVKAIVKGNALCSHKQVNQR